MMSQVFLISSAYYAALNRKKIFYLVGLGEDNRIWFLSADQKEIFHDFFRGKNARNTSIFRTGQDPVLVQK